MKMNALDWIAFILVIIGALNWGLVGAFNLNAVDLILRSIPLLLKIVYVLVGISAIYMVISAAMKK